MLKLLSLSIFLTSSIFASSMDDLIKTYENNKFSQNSRIKIQEVKIHLKQKLPIEGWYGYIVDIQAIINKQNISAKDVVFTNGAYVTTELLDIKTGLSLKDTLLPSLSSAYHDKKRLIAGSHKAKDKIVVFSDPLCPTCASYLPKLIKHVKRNKNSIALYYYHFPLLRAHPAADTLVKAMQVGKRLGLKDMELTVYTTSWDKYFPSNKNNPKKVLDAFNTVFKTSITLKQINSKKNKDIISHDIKMAEDAFVKQTPTVFINKKLDKSKLKYETLGK